jgi:hypothetical protein
VAAANRRIEAAAGTLALAAALTGCGSSGTGPLGPIEAKGYVCAIQLDHGVLTDGWPFVQNTSSSQVVIDRVGMADARGLDLLFVLQLVASHGSASGVDIWYHVSSRHYHLRTVFGLYVVQCPGGSRSPKAG